MNRFIKLRKFKLQYISDIHLEYNKNFKFISKTADNLALCGDIGSPLKPNYKKFLKDCHNNYEKIYLLSGNHEYWNKKKINMLDIDLMIEDIVRDFPNIKFLNNRVSEEKDITILGSTLWSDRKLIYKNSKYLGTGDVGNIYVNKKNVTVAHLKNLFKKNEEWLQNQINCHKNKDIIILTHHLPSYKLIIPRYQNNSKCNYSNYASNLDYLMKNPVKIWICGHSHCSYQRKIGDTDCRINAYINN